MALSLVSQRLPLLAHKVESFSSTKYRNAPPLLLSIVFSAGRDYNILVIERFFLTASWFENMQAPGTVLMVSGVFLYSLGGCDGDEIVYRKFTLSLKNTCSKEERQSMTTEEGVMPINPHVDLVEMGSAIPPLLKKNATLHWNDYSDGPHQEGSHLLSEPVLSSSFQANGPPSAIRLHPYLTTSEIGLVPSGTLRKIVWEQEARLFTFALDPILFADMAYEGLPRITGELMWEPCLDQPASFTCPVHPVLLVHSFHEVCPVEYVEIVPDLRAHDPLLQHMALALQTKIEGEGINGRFYVETLVDALAVHFLRRFHATRHSPGQGHGAFPYKLRRAITYIKAHLAQELSLTTLAAVGETSPAHFARLFKYATGLAPHRYVIACRMEEAKRLLAETAETLIDIGLHVGCADQSHFTALFHKYVGLTPKAYRDSIKN